MLIRFLMAIRDRQTMKSDDWPEYNWLDRLIDFLA